MNRTTVVYQYPVALPDVYRWAADNKFQLEPGFLGPYHYTVHRVDEKIEIIFIDYLGDIAPCNKLVLIGAFDLDDLEALMEYMQ